MTEPACQTGYFFGEFFFAGRRAVLAVIFFVATGLALFAPGAFVTLLFLVAAAGFFAADAALATGFFADLAARFGFFAIAVSEDDPAWMASSSLFKSFFGAQAF